MSGGLGNLTNHPNVFQFPSSDLEKKLTPQHITTTIIRFRWLMSRSVASNGFYPGALVLYTRLHISVEVLFNNLIHYFSGEYFSGVNISTSYHYIWGRVMWQLDIFLFVFWNFTHLGVFSFKNYGDQCKAFILIESRLTIKVKNYPLNTTYDLTIPPPLPLSTPRHPCPFIFEMSHSLKGCRRCALSNRHKDIPFKDDKHKTGKVPDGVSLDFIRSCPVPYSCKSH